MKYYCTYFDSNFIYKGLALYDSLCNNVKEFKLWVLCLDDKSHELLLRLNLQQIILLRLDDFECRNPDLLEIKNQRLLHEYYWTITPLLPLTLLREVPEIDLIAYLDADLFFYSDLQPIYDEWGDGSIYIIPHRFPLSRKNDESLVGIYNVGFVGHRRDETGIACLERWASQCIEWCHQQYDNPVAYGDQKYLDVWPKVYPGCVVSMNEGVGAGGWNILNYHHIYSVDNQLFLDNYKLIMLHLNFVELLSNKYYSACSRWFLQPVYRPYAKALKKAIIMVSQIAPEFKPVYHKISFAKLIIKLIRGGIVKIK
mgnify:CR=1 FL=1